LIPGEKKVLYPCVMISIKEENLRGCCVGVTDGKDL
jgi:hypothetical protein